MSAAPPPARRIYYGWIIVGLSFVTLAFHVVARFSFGIFQVPLIEEFGWSRGLLGGAYALAMATYALGSPFAGSLLERFGPRRVMPWGSAVVGVALAGSFFVSSIWHVFLFTGLLGGAGLAISGFATHSSIMPRWFVKKRGRATGIALSGIGIGILALSPLIERMIALWGWRMAYLILGVFVLAVLFPINMLFMRDRPEDKGQGPDGGPPRPAEEVAAAGGHGSHGKGVLTVFLSVWRDPRLWVLISLVFIVGLNNNTIFSQLQLYLVDIGFGTEAGAIMLGLVGFIRTFGSVGGGWLGDIIGRGRGMAVGSALVAVALVILLLIPAMGGGMLPGYLFVLIYGIGTGAMSSCYSALAGDCFEGPTFGVIMGFMEIAYGIGGVLGPPFAGGMFDLTRSYTIPFMTIVVLSVAAVFVAWWVQVYQERLTAAKRAA